jgi:predicted Rossmann fold flavoprotein
MRRVVVIGAGAAGTMAAIFAAEAGADTLLLERTRDGGRKILISGGGRCNLLPANLDESRFVTDSSRHTLRKMLRSWPLREQITFFERDLHIPLKEESESAKLFPVSDRARDVRDGLLARARQQGVRVQFMTTVTGLAPGESGWQIACDGMPPIHTDAVVLATGGLSVPNTGSDGIGLRVAGALGHAITPPYAALTPLVAKPAPFATLSGISLPVTITARSSMPGNRELTATATGGFLFTHNGYSGPAVLDISHVAVRSASGLPAQLTVQWTSHDEAAWLDALRPRGARTVLNVLRTELPNRVAEALLQATGIDSDLALAHLTRRQRLTLIETLTRGQLLWTGDEGYKKAEVTGGGVGLAEIDSATLESRRHPGLFLCGEMLDAFGPIGGYNFYWAWATGRAAGRGAAGR